LPRVATRNGFDRVSARLRTGIGGKTGNEPSVRPDAFWFIPMDHNHDENGRLLGYFGNENRTQANGCIGIH